MRRMLMIVALAVVVDGASAADAPLERLHTLLAPLRATADATHRLPFNYAGSGLRGATPAFKEAKRTLRDWIEAQLSSLGELDDPRRLVDRLNDALRAADLACEQPEPGTDDRCDFSATGGWNGSGFVAAIGVQSQTDGRVLVLVTGLGIVCGRDESAYAYQRRDGKWQRLWQNEQEVNPDKPFTPQSIDAVHVSWPDEQTGPRLVLTLGHKGWCSSNFYDVYYRLWRVAQPGAQSTPLLDQAQYAYLGAHDPPIIGSVGDHDALIEFTVTSLDVGLHSYETVRHYAIDGDTIARIAPVALDPRAFVEEWLKAEWRESSAWSDESHRPALAKWHGKLHADYISGEFTDEVMSCRNSTELREVDIRFEESAADVYFRVAWRPPYDFRMIEIGETHRGECDRPDQAAGATTLFPVQDWRW